MGEIRIAVIGDTHVGSNYAVFPEEFTNPESGNKIEANKWQKELFKYWVKYAEKLSPVDIMILIGDLVEGPQNKEKLGTLTLQNVQHQAMAFIELMKYWKWNKLYVIRGTEYHTEVPGVNVEEWIAQMLNAVPSSKWSEQRRSVKDLNLNVKFKQGKNMKTIKRIHFGHTVGVSIIPNYEFTPIVREAWLAKMYDELYGKYDIIVRGHLHRFRSAEISVDFLIYVNPCWQLPTPYQKKRSYFPYPDLGMTTLEIYLDGSHDLFKHVFRTIKPHDEEFIYEIQETEKYDEEGKDEVVIDV